MTALLEVRGLEKEFRARAGARIHAVSGVTFDVRERRTLALVGESGSGKSTTARCVLRLTEPTRGSVRLRGRDLLTLDGRAMRAVRADLQIVFQDPYGSLDPRMTARSAIAETLRLRGITGAAAGRRAVELLEQVGLGPEHAGRYPHEFSSGQRQRIALARALAPRPGLVVLDEPVSALDVSVQAGILVLLQDLQAELGLSYLFISHDLAVVRHVADDVAVMYLGTIVESGSCAEIFGRPAHPYTRALLAAAPVPDPDVERHRHRVVLTGEPASATAPPSGCRFRTRCPWAVGRCTRSVPDLVDRGQGHPVACHLAAELTDTEWPTKEDR